MASNRRMWSTEERATIVRASLKVGVTVNAVAKLYGVNPSQVYDWRKQAGQAAHRAKRARLLPVQVADGVLRVEIEPKPTGSVLIESQSTRVTITGTVEATILRTIMECLVRRSHLRQMHTSALQLSPAVQTVLSQDPFGGHVFVFRGRRGDLIKLLWWDGDGLRLFAERLEVGSLYGLNPKPALCH